MVDREQQDLLLTQSRRQYWFKLLTHNVLKITVLSNRNYTVLHTVPQLKKKNLVNLCYTYKSDIKIVARLLVS